MNPRSSRRVRALRGIGERPLPKFPLRNGLLDERSFDVGQWHSALGQFSPIDYARRPAPDD